MHSPKHFGDIIAPNVKVGLGLVPIVTTVEAVQPLASVQVNVYVPAAKLFGFGEIVPPQLNETEPLLEGLQDAFTILSTVIVGVVGKERRVQTQKINP